MEHSEVLDNYRPVLYGVAGLLPLWTLDPLQLAYQEHMEVEDVIMYLLY